MCDPRLLEAFQGHLALTSAPTSPSLPPHTPCLLLWHKGWLLPVVRRANYHMGLWLGDWRDTKHSRQMKVEIKPSRRGKYTLSISLPPLPDYLGTNISASFLKQRRLTLLSAVSAPCQTGVFLMTPPPAQSHKRRTSDAAQTNRNRRTQRRNPAMQPFFPLSIHHCQASVIEHLHPRSHTAIPPTPCKLAVHLHLQTNMSDR